MIVEIIVALAVAGLIVYAFFWYLNWAIGFNQDATFDAEKKTYLEYKLIPPKPLRDSRKYVFFWLNYYYIRYTV